MENMPSARLNLYSSVDWSIQQNGSDGGPGSWQAIEPLATSPCDSARSEPEQAGPRRSCL